MRSALAQSSNLCPHRLRKRHARQSDVRLLVNTLGGERCGVPLEILRRGRSCGRFDPGAGPLLTGVANQPGGRLLMGPAKPRPARQKWPSRRYGLGHGQVTGDVGSLVNAPFRQGCCRTRGLILFAGSFYLSFHRGDFHSVLHRTYAHRYPQGVRDFSQLAGSVGGRVNSQVILPDLTRPTISTLTALRASFAGAELQRKCTAKGRGTSRKINHQWGI